MRTFFSTIIIVCVMCLSAQAAGMPYADRLCPEANSKGGTLLELLAVKPVQPAEKVAAVAAELATVYDACSTAYRANGSIEGGNYGSLQYAKMRLIGGTFLNRLEKIDEARAAFADAEKRADEVAQSNSGSLGVGKGRGVPTAYRAEAEDVRNKAHAALEALLATPSATASP